MLLREKLPKDREYLVLDNLNLIHHIIQSDYHLPIYHQDYEDYFQEGCIGLILAAIRFDESREYKFSTYAIPVIKGTINRYKRDKSSRIKYPRNLYKVLWESTDLISKGYTSLEIEQITGISSQEIKKLIAISSMDSLDRVILENSNHNANLGEIIPDPHDSYEEYLSESNIYRCITLVISKMKDDVHKDMCEEWIWSLLYGEKLSQEYLSDKYGVSQSYVSRILNKFKKMFLKELSI